jgi:hypothetical protein
MTAEERAAILAQLSEPFDPSEIKWRVTHKSKDERRGAVIAYADPRAYQDRLNKIVTPAGWSSSYHVCTLTNIMRARGSNKEVMSGKVLSTCKVTIDGIGEHSGTGEDWADEECAMTSSDAQAFKRACSAFGLGRYLYNLEEVWVDLDEHKRPKRLPQLPKWAMPAKTAETGKTIAQRSSDSAQQKHGTGNPGRTESIDARIIDEIERCRRELGKQLYYEVVNKIGKSSEAGKIESKEVADAILEWLQRAKRGIEKARKLGEQVSVGQYDHIFQQVGVQNLSTVPSMAILSRLVTELIKATSRVA